MLDEVGIAFSGRLDILVNLAGGMIARKTLSEMDEDFFDKVMTLNLKSAFLVLQASQPFLGEGSAVVNVSSLAGRADRKSTRLNSSHYCASPMPSSALTKQ